MMTPMDWDQQELFTGSNGEVGVRYAFSDRGGVTFELSMHDATIQSILPRGFWLPVYMAPANNSRIDRIDGRLVVLCGFGKVSDPMGNLLLIRVATRPGFSGGRLAFVIAMILLTLLGLGIRLDWNMVDAIRGN